MAATLAAIRRYYDEHPITAERVLARLGAGAPGAGPLSPEALWPWDQDHYGGIPAVQALAQRAAVGPGGRALDVCAGLGGPARVLAHLHGARVTAVDLHPGRCAGARHLTRVVGLADRVTVVRADAQALPFRPGTFTAAISQEGLLHVPDKGRALAECARVLVPGGRLAFTDWVARPRLGAHERRWLADWLAAVTLETMGDYRARLGAAGFVDVQAEDLTEPWLGILRERLRRDRVRRRHAGAGPLGGRAEERAQLTALLLGLVEGGRLGAARLSGAAAPAVA